MSDMPMTRRAIIGAACVAPFSVPSLASAIDPDDGLVQLWDAFKAAEAASDAIFDKFGIAAGTEHWECEGRPLWDRIESLPTQGPRGLAIKTLLLIHAAECGIMQEPKTLIASTRAVIDRLLAQA